MFKTERSAWCPWSSRAWREYGESRRQPLRPHVKWFNPACLAQYFNIGDVDYVRLVVANEAFRGSYKFTYNAEHDVWFDTTGSWQVFLSRGHERAIKKVLDLPMFPDPVNGAVTYVACERGMMVDA